MIDTIYLVRHGLRLDWDTDDWKSVTGIPNDPPLNELGEKQSQEIKTYFESLPISERPTAIFSSPSYRCLQTIQPTAQALGLPIFIEHGLSEWYSTVKVDGTLHPSFPTAIEVRPFVPEVDSGWPSATVPRREGETLEDLSDRCARFTSEFFPKLDLERGTEQHKRIMFVGHVAPMIVLIRDLLSNESLPLRLGCSSITILNKTGSDDWNTVSIGSGTHLKRGTLKDWGFEDMGLY